MGGGLSNRTGSIDAPALRRVTRGCGIVAEKWKRAPKRNTTRVVLVLGKRLRLQASSPPRGDHFGGHFGGRARDSTYSISMLYGRRSPCPSTFFACHAPLEFAGNLPQPSWQSARRRLDY